MLLSNFKTIPNRRSTLSNEQNKPFIEILDVSYRGGDFNLVNGFYIFSEADNLLVLWSMFFFSENVFFPDLVLKTWMEHFVCPCAGTRDGRSIERLRKSICVEIVECRIAKVAPRNFCFSHVLLGASVFE